MVVIFQKVSNFLYFGAKIFTLNMLNISDHFAYIEEQVLEFYARLRI